MFRSGLTLPPHPASYKLSSALAVVVVCAMAWPVYSDHLKHTRRAVVRDALLHAAQWMDRTATARGGYPPAAAVPVEVLHVEGGHYVMTVFSNDGVTYTLTAMPNAAQSGDLCGAYRINQAGTRVQLATAEVPKPLSSAECWSP